MKTYLILLNAAITAKTYEQAQRIDDLVIMAEVLNRINRNEVMQISLAINKNEAVDSDRWRLIDEFEEQQLKATGLIY